jgi:protein-L-isoaspartate(D-aspartate) O-methyltransferase
VSPTKAYQSQADLIQHLKLSKVLTSARIEQILRAVRRDIYGGKDARLGFVDQPQSIGYQATISAMHMHVLCLQLLEEHLRDGARGLDVGSGSGYLTAVMGRLLAPKGSVIGIEHITELVQLGREHVEEDQPQLLQQGVVQFVEGDGRLGYPPSAPYDFIQVGAASETVPPALLEQLALGGRLIIPVGPPHGGQSLMQIDRLPGGGYQQTPITWVTYIPLCDREQQWPSKSSHSSKP